MTTITSAELFESEWNTKTTKKSPKESLKITPQAAKPGFSLERPSELALIQT